MSKATWGGATKVLDIYGVDYIFIETVGVGQSEVDIVKNCRHGTNGNGTKLRR